MLSNNNYFSKATGIADEWRLDADSVNLAVMPRCFLAPRAASCSSARCANPTGRVSGAGSADLT